MNSQKTVSIVSVCAVSDCALFLDLRCYWVCFVFGNTNRRLYCSAQHVSHLSDHYHRVSPRAALRAASVQQASTFIARTPA